MHLGEDLSYFEKIEGLLELINAGQLFTSQEQAILREIIDKI